MAFMRTWLSLLCYLTVMVAITTLKPFYQIGYLWDPARQRVRELHLIPFDEFAGSTWFAPLFEYAGNTAFFVPFGVLAFILVPSVRKVTACGFAVSLAVEVVQYLGALGRTDIDDLLFNTLGALIGALIARACGRRAYPVWRGLSFALTAVFVALVALGPRLGDADKVVDLAGAYPCPMLTNRE